MDPIKLLKKEKKHLRRLKDISRAIYRRVALPEVSVYPSAEPVPPGEQYSLDYRAIRGKGIWGGVFGCAWFRVRGTIPESAAGRHVVLHINTGGEGAVYSGTEPRQAISLITSYIDRLQPGAGKSIIEISGCAEAGAGIELYIDAGYNGYYNFPFGRGIFHYAEICVADDGLRDYYYDYLCVASLLSVTDEKERRMKLEKALDESYAVLKARPRVRSSQELCAPNASAGKARMILEPLLSGRPEEGVEFTAIGHSHLDLAWLWPVRETKRKAQRTFTNQLNNAVRYPDYIYGASQPWQFEYIRDNHPGQYKALLGMVERGQMELQGGMWVEADMNIPSGEALIRQIHYGAGFFREEFGAEMRICWLPDVFGYNGNLPQILKKSGLPYFLTIKLSWNEHNRFPYRSFVWQGIDGSEVLVHMPPDDTYNSSGSPACARHAAGNYTERLQAPEALFVYGLGDGGGGPGEAHIELVSRQKSLDGSPRMIPGKASDFFERMEKYRGGLPVHRGELYLEKHQGTYTTQGANKYYNRRCEYALQDLEAFCALAWLRGREYPQDKIDRWWKEALLYQFHDIIPGSSITRVYEESRERYKAILEEVEAERADAAAFMRDGEDPGVFNPTGYSRTEYLRLDDGWYSAETEPYGFAVLEPVTDTDVVKYDGNMIENDCLRLRFSDDGAIVSAASKRDGFEYSGGRMNALRLYRDKWLYYNAWDIDWEYYKKPSRLLKAYRFETFADGPVVTRRQYYKHGRTTIAQDVSLRAGKPVVYFKTTCDYHETFRMLRADFDVSVRAPFVKCDIQMGSIERSTGNETAAEKAQFEICAHKYVDLSDGSHGISLMNDCKYGHRVKGNRMSLNLLRSPVYPDKTADRRHHSFTYALFLHEGGCGAETLAYSYALNKPLYRIDGVGRAFSVASTDDPAVIIETIKRAWSGDGVVVRLFESLGRPAVCRLSTAFDAGDAVETDLRENETRSVDPGRLSFAPFEIKTIKFRVKGYED